MLTASHVGDEAERVALGNDLVLDPAREHRRCLVGCEELCQVPRFVRGPHVDGLGEGLGEVAAVLTVVFAATELDARLLGRAAGLQVGVAVLVDDCPRACTPGLVIDRAEGVVQNGDDPFVFVMTKAGYSTR